MTTPGGHRAPDPPEDPEELPNNSQLMTVALVGENRDVLELGCSAGHVTELMVANGCTVTGVEIDPAMAESARRFAAEVHVADLDLVLPSELLGGRQFDTIVVADVFEHLKRPVEVLADLANVLAPGGRLIASIPNVTHIDVRLMLLGGRWTYQDGGLLDRTHLRFYDAPGVDALFRDAGWTTTRVERTVVDPLSSELAPLIRVAWLSEDVMDTVADDLEATTYQFIVTAVPGLPEPEGTGQHARVERDRPDRQGAEGPASGSGTSVTERLMTENDHLRHRARQLETDLEALQWEVAAERARPVRRAERGALKVLRWLWNRVRRVAAR